MRAHPEGAGCLRFSGGGSEAMTPAKTSVVRPRMDWRSGWLPNLAPVLRTSCEQQFVFSCEQLRQLLEGLDSDLGILVMTS